VIKYGLLARLARLLLTLMPALASAQNLKRMGEIKTQLQELSRKMANCAPDSDCQMRAMQEMQALVQEHMGLNLAQGQSAVQTQPAIPTCTGQIRPG